MGMIKKLLIKKGYRITVVNAPDYFSLPAEERPEEVEVANQLDGSFDFVLLFAHNQDELRSHVPKILEHLKESAVLWVAYPKKSSKIKSDINRDQGWEVLQEAGFIGVSLVSLDDTWSAIRFREEHLVKK